MTPDANNTSPNRITARLPAFVAGAAVLVLICYAAARLADRASLPSPEIPDQVGPADVTPESEWAFWLDESAAGVRETIRNNEFAVTDPMLRQVSRATALENLILDQGVVSDAALDAVAELPRLRHLRLRLSPITDEGLQTLSRSKSLAVLNLPQADCTAKGIEHLAALQSLRQLRLGSPRLGNEASDAISQLVTLQSLHLIGVEITDQGLQKIAALPQLQSLYLDDSNVTEAGWQWLFDHYPELHVHVDQQHHDRDPQAHEH